MLRRQARRRRAIASLPDAIELLIVAVRAGVAPAVAVELVAPQLPSDLGEAFADVVHRLHRGHRLAEALDALAEHLGPAASTFTDALSTADRYGHPLGPVLDRLAADVRLERRRLAERHARTLPVRLAFPLVVCTLPSFVLLAIVPAVLGALSTLRGSLP